MLVQIYNFYIYSIFLVFLNIMVILFFIPTATRAKKKMRVNIVRIKKLHGLKQSLQYLNVRRI